MNKLLILIISLAFTLFPALAKDQEYDKFVSLEGKATLKRESDHWLKISVPFRINLNPDLDALDGRKPSSREELFNPKFLDNLEISLVVCFRNDFIRKVLKADKNDRENFQYYSASLKVMVLEIGANYVAHFLFPAAIAERDNFGGSYPQMLGYVIDFSRNGTQFHLSDSIMFENIRSDEILKKFKSEALTKSIENDGILIPAHKIDQSYLRDLGPVYLD